MLHKITFLATIVPMLTLGHLASAESPDPALTAPAVMETKMALRDMWVEHVFWIRSYVLATAAADDEQRDVAEAEVVDNAKSLADTITPFYGEAASNQLFTLLGGHWGAVKSYNGATFDASPQGQEHAVDRLTANAREIAAFLSGANPYLPEDAVFGLLSAHGAHHVTQINQIETGAFEKEAETWAAMRKHMLVIADSIAEALAQQFPERLVSQN